MLKRHGGSPIVYATLPPFISEGRRLSAMAPRARARRRRLTIEVVATTITGAVRRAMAAGIFSTTKMGAANLARRAVRGASIASLTVEGDALPEISGSGLRNVNYNGIA